MVQPLLPNWPDDIRGAWLPQPRTAAGSYAAASIDKGALDGDGRPVNPPEYTSLEMDADRPSRIPTDRTGAEPSIGTKKAEFTNSLDIQNAKRAVDNWLRVVGYQFQVAVKPFVNQITMDKLEAAFAENVQKLVEANTRHVAQMYEGIIELRVRETIDQRAKVLADLTILQEREKHKAELANLRASIDSVVAREKNDIRQQYVGFRERMRDEVISEVREELTEKLEELFDDMEE